MGRKPERSNRITIKDLGFPSDYLEDSLTENQPITAPTQKWRLSAS